MAPVHHLRFEKFELGTHLIAMHSKFTTSVAAQADRWNSALSAPISTKSPTSTWPLEDD